MVCIIVIVNQKGGVGKIMIVVNLVVFLVNVFKCVLLVDLDLQGNVIMGSGVDKCELVVFIYDLLLGEFSVVDVCVQIVEGYDLLFGNIDLIVVEIQLMVQSECEQWLKCVLVLICDEYDYILIDCLLVLLLLMFNVLVVVDLVIVLMQCEYYVLEGFSVLVEIIEVLCVNFNLVLEIEGVLCIMFDVCNNLVNVVLVEFIEYFGDCVFCIIVLCNVCLVEVFSYGQSIVGYDCVLCGGVVYLGLVGEIICCNNECNKVGKVVEIV